MPKFKFRLATLLRIREAARLERRANLAAVIQAREQLAQRRSKLESQRSQLHRYTRSSAEPGLVDVAQLANAHRYELALERHEQQLASEDCVLAEQLEACQQALLAADRGVRMLENLRQRQATEFQRQESLSEVKQLDEAARRSAGPFCPTSETSAEPFAVGIDSHRDFGDK